MAAALKQYTREFKHEAVRLVTEQGLRIAQAARDLGLNDNVLSRRSAPIL
jgi:transposase